MTLDEDFNKLVEEALESSVHIRNPHYTDPDKEGLADWSVTAEYWRDMYLSLLNALSYTGDTIAEKETDEGLITQYYQAHFTLPRATFYDFVDRAEGEYDQEALIEKEENE